VPDPASLEDDFVMLVAVGCPGSIDGVPVPARAFNAWARVVFYWDRSRPNLSAGVLEPLKTKATLSFLEHEVLVREADAAGFDPTDAELDAELERVYASRGGFEAWAASAQPGRGLEEVRAVMRRVVRAGLYACSSGGCEVSEGELRDQYARRIDAYTVREEVEASHILIKVARGASPAEVAAARQRAEAVAVGARLPGADFAEVARKHSEGPSAPRGGALGFFSRGRMVKPFEDAAFSAEVGEVVGPVRTAFGWHLLVVTDRRGPGTRAFEEVRDELERELVRQRRAEALTATTAAMRSKHRVVPTPEALRVVAVAADVSGAR
jgi:parvulin-like peptidyl-prolyl isomerase